MKNTDKLWMVDQLFPILEVVALYITNDRNLYIPFAIGFKLLFKFSISGFVTLL